VLNRPTHEAVEPVVVVLRIDTAAVEVQVPTVRCGVERGRPVVPVAASVVPRRAVAVARARKKGHSVATLYENTKGLHEARPSCIFSFSSIPERIKDGQPM